MTQNKFTTNNNPTLVAVSSADGETPVYLYADPTSHGLIISASITGADGAITDGVDSGIKATVKDYTSSNPLAVVTVDTNGDYVAGSGGTQYTEGDTDATITGTAILWEDAADTLRAVSAAKPLPISDAAGSLTVDQGTAANLKTQAEAYQGGSAVASGNPLEVNLRSSTVGIATSAKQDTGNTSLASIDGKITAVNTGAVVISSGSVTADTELTTADLDTGAGTDTRAVIGLVGSKSGGGALILGDATAGLKVDLGADNDVTVTSGSITANAGTNLNTSALALETGGNLAGAATSLAVIDDWDESDRAKVNPIVGQAGVAGGAGATGATVLRVVQANNSGKTIVSAGGSAGSSGNNTLISAGTNRLKVHAFSLTTVSTTAMTCIFQDGAGGTELWRVVIQAISGASAGANLSIALPSFLFATSAATLLNLNLSSANAVHWSVSYVDEA